MFSQGLSNDRQPVAAGRFYPGDKASLESQLSRLFAECRETPVDGVRAIVSPHAGYVFSGRIAAEAFSTVSPDAGYDNIFIIGSSHVMAFDGASVYPGGDYITPLGNAAVNTDIAGKLKSENQVFNFPATAHRNEHSIEVQIPFIQYHFKKKIPIIPVIIGTNNLKTIRKIADALKPYFTARNLFVISSDFSHYPSYKDAVVNDKTTAIALATGDPETFLTTLDRNESKNTPGLVTSMCGWTSGLTLLYLAEKDPSLEFRLLGYCNSGDSPAGGKDEVVGYEAMALISKKSGTTENNQNDENEVTFTSQEKKILFEIAWNNIKMSLDGKKVTEPEEKRLTPNLKKPFGAFVTLKENGTLRGCIGRFISHDPLYKVVAASAISSAFEDPRFMPVTSNDLRKLEMEITVLGPLRKISGPSEIILGKHGIYIKKGSRTGTMLPQVAIENHWSVEQFLGYTSRDKAGIGWDGWKDAELYVYDGIVLEESGK